MIHIHFVTKTYYPVPGGLEKSAHRIMQALSTNPEFKTHVYVTDVTDFKEGPGIKNIKKHTDFLLEPYVGRQEDIFELMGECNRADYLVLKREISQTMLSYSQDQHVIISFYISSTGFTCQHLASQLGLPHIACIRGSDFYRDLHNVKKIKAIEWVIEKATEVVTINEEQARMIHRFFGKSSHVSTLYNSVDIPFLENQWKRRTRETREPKEPVVLFSDTGFSYKKGTHILLKAFLDLINKGYPVVLNLAGVLDNKYPECLSYWESVLKEYQSKYPSSFFYHHFLKGRDLLKLMRESDIYCSATLSEGCSNSRIQALAFGIPMMSTACGELKEILEKLGNPPSIVCAEPGDKQGFSDALEDMVKATLSGTEERSLEFTRSLQDLFSPAREKEGWEKVIKKVLDKVLGNAKHDNKH